MMNSGTVVCSGSPAFLKEKFGHGFKLNVKKMKNFEEAALKRVLDLHLEDYYIETDIAAEMVLLIYFFYFLYTKLFYFYYFNFRLLR